MNDPRTPLKSALTPEALQKLSSEVKSWESGELAAFIAKAPERQKEFKTIGGFPVKRVYSALDLQDTPIEDIGLPGRFPFTRGPYPTMYRGRVWTMRQIAGFGTAEDTNGRFKYRSEERRVGKECRL